MMNLNNSKWSRDLTAWLIICVVVGVVCLIYLSMGLAASNGPLLMPLDDSYIHFQYARQMASGEPYVYSPGDDPTSGATSFLYTPLLSIGYLIGFHGLSLAYWAVAWGLFAFLLSAWLIYRLILESLVAKRPLEPLFEQGGEQQAMWWISLLLTLAYVVTGAFAWAAVSGMETMLFVLAVLLSLYTYQRGDPKYIAMAGAFAALTRPEGAIIALTLTLILLMRSRRAKQFSLWDFLPFVAIYVQPLVNFLVTGSVSASGNQAKSILYDTTIPMDERISKVVEQWWRIKGELVFGANEVDGAYMTFIVAFLAMLAIVLSLRTSLSKRELRPAVLAFVWIILLGGAIATLDTAFWHFKRYQLPMMALLFPLAGSMLLGFVSIGVINRRWLIGIAAVILIFQVTTTLDFAGRYHDNIGVVLDQQLAMARWVDENLPEDARVGVHDVGMMAYIGNRRTYDVVGLTTPDAAEAWWQGPGAVYETMAHHKYRPDYFAIYPDVRGLPMLLEAGVFGEELARFEIELPKHTVASATGTQIVTRAGWSLTDAETVVHQPSILPYLEGFDLVDTINIANLESEFDANYDYWTPSNSGFATEVHSLSYWGCEVECDAIDGGRLIFDISGPNNSGEAFDFGDEQGGAFEYLVILRVQATQAAILTASFDRRYQLDDYNVVPSIPGHWVDIPFRFATSDPDAISFGINAIDDTAYFPYGYWIYRRPVTSPSSTVTFVSARAVFSIPSRYAYERDEVSLVDLDVEQNSDNIMLRLEWYSNGNLTRDGKIFIHLYNDPDQPPIAQMDVWPGGSLPPANWLSGYRSDTVTLPLEGVPAGTYSLAIGFYDPNTNERYTVKDERTDEESDRLFLGEVVVGHEQRFGGITEFQLVNDLLH